MAGVAAGIVLLWTALIVALRLVLLDELRIRYVLLWPDLVLAAATLGG